MIKTKYLVTSQSFLDPEEIDDLINDFLEENPDIEVIDIKYQSNVSAVADGGVSATYFNNSALIIYREKENNGYQKEYKEVVPQCVADWYEKHKDNLEDEIYYLIRNWDDKERTSDFCKWFDDVENESIKTLVNMHQFGYEVKEEARYIVKFKGVCGDARYLNHEIDGNWYINSRQETHQFRVTHTRKELEEADFGWVFNCPGVEVKEVE